MYTANQPLLIEYLSHTLKGTTFGLKEIPDPPSHTVSQPEPDPDPGAL
jgi:hypothetical protein